MSPLHYRELQPPRELDDFVECFWNSFGNSLTAKERKHRVLPDGCIDILFSAESSNGGSFSSNCSLSLVGTMTRYHDFFLPANPLHIAVRFKPAAATRFLPFSASEVTDAIVPLSDVWGAEGRRLHEKLSETRSIPECINVLTNGLLRKLASCGRARKPAADYAVRSIVASPGRAKINRLAASLNTSPRQLRRLVHAQAGLGPKRLSRILRFQRLFQAIRHVTQPDWADLALDCGYFDQAHMISEFRQLSGYTPQQFQLERTKR